MGNQKQTVDGQNGHDGDRKRRVLRGIVRYVSGFERLRTIILGVHRTGFDVSDEFPRVALSARLIHAHRVWLFGGLHRWEVRIEGLFALVDKLLQATRSEFVLRNLVEDGSVFLRFVHSLFGERGEQILLLYSDALNDAGSSFIVHVVRREVVVRVGAIKCAQSQLAVGLSRYRVQDRRSWSDILHTYRRGE